MGNLLAKALLKTKPPWLATSPPFTLPEWPDWALPPLPNVGELFPRVSRGAPETRVAARTRVVKKDARILNDLVVMSGLKRK